MLLLVFLALVMAPVLLVLILVALFNPPASKSPPPGTSDSWLKWGSALWPPPCGGRPAAAGSRIRGG
jgi:hypothetical protein